MMAPHSIDGHTCCQGMCAIRELFCVGQSSTGCRFAFCFFRNGDSWTSDCQHMQLTRRHGLRRLHWITSEEDRAHGNSLCRLLHVHHHSGLRLCLAGLGHFLFFFLKLSIGRHVVFNQLANNPVDRAHGRVRIEQAFLLGRLLIRRSIDGCSQSFTYSFRSILNGFVLNQLTVRTTSVADVSFLCNRFRFDASDLITTRVVCKVRESLGRLFSGLQRKRGIENRTEAIVVLDGNWIVPVIVTLSAADR